MDVGRDGKKLCVTYKVRGYHIDINGHVNNAEYLHFLEAARDDFIEYLGLSLPALAGRGVQIILSEVHLRFRVPALAGDRLVVWGWLCELRRVKSAWAMEIRRAGTGELLTQARFDVGFLDSCNRIIAIPPDVRSALETVYLPDSTAS